jgi:hypothetical protein
VPEARAPARLIYWNIEGKGVNGIPDTIVGKYPSGIRRHHSRSQARGEGTDRATAWKRIEELRAAGQDADWYDSYERFAELIGYDLSL